MNPDFPIPEFNPSYTFFVIVFVYFLRVAYIKYLKPKFERGEKPKLSFSLKEIPQHLEAIVRLILYTIAIYIGLLTIHTTETIPETTVEVPAKLLVLLMGFVLLFTTIMMAFLARRYVGEN